MIILSLSFVNVYSLISFDENMSRMKKCWLLQRRTTYISKNESLEEIFYPSLWWNEHPEGENFENQLIWNSDWHCLVKQVNLDNPERKISLTFSLDQSPWTNFTFSSTSKNTAKVAFVMAETKISSFFGVNVRLYLHGFLSATHSWFFRMIVVVFRVALSVITVTISG